MGKVKRLFFVAMVMCILLNINPAFAGGTKTAAFSDDIGLIVNETRFTTPVVIIDGVSYLPIRALGYAINADVNWTEKTRTISITKQTKPIKSNNLPQKSDKLSGKKPANFSNDIKLMVGAAPANCQVVIIEGKSYLPLRDLAENMDIIVTWENSFRVINIVDPAIAIQNDVLLGKWKGYIEIIPVFSALGEDNSRKDTFEYFIAKNQDGSYHIIAKETRPDKSYILAELKGSYDSAHKILTGSFVKYIQKKGWDSSSYNDDKLVLSGNNTLYFTSPQSGMMEKQKGI